MVHESESEHDTGAPAPQPSLGSQASTPLQYTPSSQGESSGVCRQRMSVASQRSVVQLTASSHCPSSVHGPPSVGSPASSPTASPPSIWSGLPAAPASAPASPANGLGTAWLPQADKQAASATL